MGQEVDNGSRVGLGAADVLVAGLERDEGPAVFVFSERPSFRVRRNVQLLDVDGGGPLVVAEKMEVWPKVNPHCPAHWSNHCPEYVRLMPTFPK